MEAVKYEPNEHYEILEKWWADFDWKPVPHDALPPNGVVVFSDGKPHVAGFIYMSDCAMAFISWVIGDKFADPLTRGKCLHLLIDHLIQIGKQNNKTFIYTNTGNKGLVNTYKKHGLIPLENEVVTMVRVLGDRDSSFLC